MLFAIEVLHSKLMTAAARVLVRFYPQTLPLVFVGPGSAMQLAQHISRAGHQKVLIATDKVLVELGLVGRVADALEEYGVELVIFDEIMPDPTIQQVEAGAAVLREHGCDGVLAIGGGSSIDAAKVIALQAEGTVSVADIAGFFRVSATGLPVYVIPTTAGTGSEATMVSVITDAEAQQKIFIADPKLTPRKAALDADLMRGMPPHITAATGMDALTHALESLLSVNATEDTRYFARIAAKLIFDNLAVAYAEPDNLHAREAMALGSYYAAAAFTRSNVGYVHGISHQLGAIYHVPHGVANAMVLPHVLDFYRRTVTDQMAQIADALNIGDPSATADERAQALVDAVRQLVVGVGIPQSLDKLRRDDFDEIVQRVRKESHGMFGYPVPSYMRPDDIRLVLENLLPQA